jgi:hypothetical protein
MEKMCFRIRVSFFPPLFCLNYRDFSLHINLKYFHKVQNGHKGKKMFHITKKKWCAKAQKWNLPTTHTEFRTYIIQYVGTLLDNEKRRVDGGVFKLHNNISKVIGTFQGGVTVINIDSWYTTHNIKAHRRAVPPPPPPSILRRVAERFNERNVSVFVRFALKAPPTKSSKQQL